MADSFVNAADSSKFNSQKQGSKASKPIPPQVKFVFGDEDSDSGRSCSASLSSPFKSNSSGLKDALNKQKNPETNVPGSTSARSQLTETSSSESQNFQPQTSHLSISAGKEGSGVEIAKGRLSIAPLSPSTRVVNANAIGSPIHVTVSPTEFQSMHSSQEKDFSPINKLPLTAQFLNSHISSGQTPANTASLTSTQSSTSNAFKSLNKNVVSYPNMTAVSPISPGESSENTREAEPSTSSQNANGSSSGPALLSRTQQKLFLQRQHTHTDDVTSLLHPQNQMMLSKELERVNREYGWIRRHHNPVLESLQRVMAHRRSDATQ